MKMPHYSGWLTLSVLSVLLLLFVGGLYDCHFGPQSAWHLSRETEDWARFGEYIGGVFGMLAFIGVLVTLNLRREQLDDLRGQFPLSELQRLLASASQSIDSVMP